MNLEPAVLDEPALVLEDLLAGRSLRPLRLSGEVELEADALVLRAARQPQRRGDRGKVSMGRRVVVHELEIERDGLVGVVASSRQKPSEHLRVGDVSEEV